MRIVAVLGIALALSAPGAAPAQEREMTPEQRRLTCAVATRPVAQALAEKAAAHLQAVGRDKAFADFADAKGPFRTGDLYVFVFDFEGVLVASGGFPHTVGRNIFTHSAEGRTNVGAMFEVAKGAGKGWVEYQWLNPCSRQREPKGSYVIRAGDLIVGVGAYVREGV